MFELEVKNKINFECAYNKCNHRRHHHHHQHKQYERVLHVRRKIFWKFISCILENGYVHAQAQSNKDFPKYFSVQRFFEINLT